MARRFARRIPAAFLWSALMLSSGPPAAAETDCGKLLAEAGSHYRAGRFEQALAATRACLETSPARDMKIQMLALAAKSQLAMDERGAAADAVTELLRLDPEFKGALSDPPLFVSLVEGLRFVDTSVKVSSVSKTPESLREAPATVTVITSEELERRGYRDLEAPLHDLAGFDITRTNGVTYSNVYQRGYRSDATNRTLILVDGVEENDLWTGTVYWSRQFPLSNVERIEVIYGPGSTMYGSNAFAGVINVITREPGASLAKDESYGVSASLTAGSFGTSIVDATATGRTANESLSWSLTSRFYRSDEFDLSAFEDWDYDPAFYASIPYADRLRISDPAAVDAFRQAVGADDCTGRDGCFYAIGTGSVELTPAGVQRAVALDQSALGAEVGGAPVGFSDDSDDRFLQGKLRLGNNFTFGFQTWRRDEGATPWYTDQQRPGSANGNRWVVDQSWFSFRYARALSDRLDLTLFSRYKEHRVNGESLLWTVRNYERRNLGLLDLVAGEQPFWDPLYFYSNNSQLRNELRLSYERSDRFNLVAGLELRNGNIAGRYINSKQPNPSETGDVLTPVPGGNRFDTQDVGLFAQASFRPFGDNLKFVVGGRLDNNEVRETLGYGTVFNPRLAAVYTRGDWVLKAMYSEAFRDVSNFQKFAIVPGQRDLPNPDLEPERVENVELSLGWQVSERLSADLVAYDASYSNVVELQRNVPFPCSEDELAAGEDCEGRTTNRFEATGALAIRGLTAHAAWRFDRFSVTGNYTYTDSVNVRALDDDGNPLGADLPTGDVARHQVNLAANLSLRDRLDVNLRLNYVGTKRTGPGTTISTNPDGDVPSYTVTHGAVTYRDLFPGVSLQLAIDNLFDSLYYSPGIRASDKVFNASRVPQPERSFFLRLIYSP